MEQVFLQVILPELSKFLRANLYVMLIDLEKGKIIKEEKVADFNGPCL